MPTILDQIPDSPNGAFDIAIESLIARLADEDSTMPSIAEAFAQVLDLLDAVLVETPIYSAMRAVLLLNFRALGHEFIDGRTGMGIRRGAMRDITFHSKRVNEHSWT